MAAVLPSLQVEDYLELRSEATNNDYDVQWTVERLVDTCHWPVRRMVLCESFLARMLAAQGRRLSAGIGEYVMRTWLPSH